MIKKFYKATSGYHDVAPGQTTLGFAVIMTDKGEVKFAPKGPIDIDFNEIQIDGDAKLRREHLPNDYVKSKILLMDDPNYQALKFRRSAMATKNIPLHHSDCFVARWLCLSNAPKEHIEKGVDPKISIYCTKGGYWGNIKALTKKKSMLAYISQLDDNTRDELDSAKSSAEFTSKFVDWRSTLSNRITYQFVEE